MIRLVRNYLSLLTKGERVLFLVMMVLDYIASMIVFFLLGVGAFIAYTVITLPLGYIWGMTLKRRVRRLRLIEEWRAAHPDLSDHWLPKELRGE